MAQKRKFYKNNSSDVIWWLDNSDVVGEWVFSFDKKTLFNMFADYPHKLTPEQKEIFDKEQFQRKGTAPHIRVHRRRIYI